MTWDPVPWMISGGAEHSTNVARNVAYAAFGGGEGIVQTEALEVRALTVPGGSVQVFPGTCAIQNRSPGAMDELYVGRNTAVHNVTIAATAGAGRSDLIVARVEDPNEPGAPWDAPESVAHGPYIFTRVITNVPASTTSAQDLGLSDSMIALARIDIPPSTGTITQGMIKDLRVMAQPKSLRRMKMFPAAGTTGVVSWLDAPNSWAIFPSNAKMTVQVPSWATHARAFCTVNAITQQVGGGINDGWVTVKLNTAGQTELAFTNTFWINTNEFLVPLNVAGGGEGLALPAGYRGKDVEVSIKFYELSTASNRNKIGAAGSYCTAHLDVEFYQAPISNVG